MASDHERELAIKRIKARRDFVSLAATAAMVLIILNIIWAVTGAGYYWPIWAAMGLGIALVVAAFDAYGPRRRPISEDEIEREIRRR